MIVEIVIIIALIILFYFEKERNNSERESHLRTEKQMLKMVSDLNDKVYFLRTHEYVAKKSLEETKETDIEEQTNEEAVPLEDVMGNETRDVIAALMKEKNIKVK